MSSSWTKLRRYLAGKPSKTGLQTDSLPNRKTPIECTLGKMMIKVNPDTGSLEYMGEIGQGEYIKLDHTDLQNIKERMEELEDENRLLKLKNEILLDLLSSTTLDAKYMEQTLLKIKNEGFHSINNQEEEEKEKREKKERKEKEKKEKKEKKRMQSTNEQVVKRDVPKRQISSSHGNTVRA
ncbi:predicted protein [Naegleria gruberi]|uniref:Predicted protein n=1 Tax=Naegleria gruberi TaxID=5762 RepID=D2W437_NAEGR|nr:uncharacterized protein NAEGRDRAFT_54544 [Naegleria gruberi]EFC36175.1 predicted protein [Naegleria gruberi]|eukprot:XP_002668919.1 predicted protein [Naegleria gruberi strain NEG-M]